MIFRCIISSLNRFALCKAKESPCLSLLKYKKAQVSFIRCHGVFPDKNIRKDNSEELQVALINSETYSDEDWKLLSSKLVNKEYKISQMHINEKNVEGVIMSLCLRWKLTIPGQRFYKYLQSKGDPIHVGISTKFLQLSSHTANINIDKEEIIKLYQSIKKEKTLDSISTERCIIGLSNFEDCWKEALKLLKQVEVTHSPPSEVYSAVIVAAFKFNDDEEAWQLWSELTNTPRKVLPTVYSSYLDKCKLQQNHDEAIQQIKKLFEFCVKNELIIPNIDVANEIADTFKVISSKGNKKLIVEKTEVSKYTGVCKSCQQKLKAIKVTSREFIELKAMFFDKAIVGKNIFLKSHPKELKKFESFLEAAKPYDIVLDALNIAYRSKSRDVGLLALRIHNVLQYFLDKSWKVVIIGRKHMAKWPNKYMDYVFENSKTFLIDNVSQDDPFLLFATLHGGPKTNFLSNDFMRSHVFLLEEERLKKIFIRWQLSHQFKINYITSDGKTDILGPLSYLPHAQSQSLQDGLTSIHIPYENIYKEHPPATLEPPTNWLCVKLQNPSIDGSAKS